MIAALAVGAASGYIYVRGEYRYLSIIMQKAIRDAYAKASLARIFSAADAISIFTGTAAQGPMKLGRNRR